MAAVIEMGELAGVVLITLGYFFVFSPFMYHQVMNKVNEIGFFPTLVLWLAFLLLLHTPAQTNGFDAMGLCCPPSG